MRLLAALVVAASVVVHAQSPGPQPVPLPPPIEQPRDVRYPGTIDLRVDATDLDRHLYHVRETIPIASAAPLVLLYPQWIPGNHSPTGRVDFVGGLVIRANGARVEWRRDPVDVFAFHVQPPPGATRLEVEFDFASPFDSSQGRVVMTPDLLDLQWNQVVLYPAGHFARQIEVRPTVTLPDGWAFATALEKTATTGTTTTFDTVSLETLLDSPLFAGRYSRVFDLDPGGGIPVRLNVFADRPEQLEAKPEAIELHRALVRQADRLFGSRHYEHYDFLLAVSDRLGGIGLEHLQSSEDGVDGIYFTDWARSLDDHDLLPHEYTHSWNGKFRRPADLWSPNFNVPMRGTLLWVYEGQTQYWGNVLAARAGLVTRQQALDALAITAATYDQRAGRQWRTLQDTTTDPIATLRRPQPWRSWLRFEDYYSEGELVWLDVDTRIRELSGGRRSLDDFARAFFGTGNGDPGPLTYTFDDVVRALNAVQPFDWTSLLRQRLTGHGPGAPLDGITRGGYKLVFTETQSDYSRMLESRRNTTDASYSLGLVAAADGRITDVAWDSPAFKAGLVPGQLISGVNGEVFRGDRLRAAITAARDATRKIELLIRSGDAYRTIAVDYHGGLRYPHLERDPARPGMLDDIFAPRR
jgi:predicted metalloprotease with PDZ domain